MQSTMLTDNEQVMYAVSVNGQIVTQPCTTASAAEAQILQLSEAMQTSARVVPVTSDGRQVLLG